MILVALCVFTLGHGAFARPSDTLQSTAPAPADSAAPAPFLRFRDTTLGYHGPSEDFTNLTELRVGWFGPSDPDDPLTGDLWWAANRAVCEANEQSAVLGSSSHSDRAPAAERPDAQSAAGGASLRPSSSPDRLPFRLVPRWSVDVWGTGVSQLTRMVYDEPPLAIIGSIDSASTHLAEQVVAKAQLPLISPIATDPSVTLAGVSWMFACAPSDTAIARVLVDAVLAELGNSTLSPPPVGAPDGRPPCVETPLAGAQASQATPLTVETPAPQRKPTFVLLTTTDHESRMTAREVLREFSRRGRLPESRFDLPAGAAVPPQVLDTLVRTAPAAVVVVAGAEDAARLVRGVRDTPGPVPIFGSHSLGRARFAELAGAAAEGVQFPLLFVPDRGDETSVRFVARFTAERGHAPDYTAAFTYDATRLLLEAIRRAGPNRARIRDALAQLSPWPGVAGVIEFDGTGQNRRTDIPLGTISNGAPVSLPSALVQVGTALRAVRSVQPAPVHDSTLVGAPLAAPSASIAPGAARGAPTPRHPLSVALADASERRPYFDPEIAFSPSP